MGYLEDGSGGGQHWQCDVCKRIDSGPYWEILRCDGRGDPLRRVVVCTETCGKSHSSRTRWRSIGERLSEPSYSVTMPAVRRAAEKPHPVLALREAQRQAALDAP